MTDTSRYAATSDAVIILPDFNPETDKRLPSHPHDPAALQDASLLSLGRIQNTPAAHALAEMVSEALRPHLGSRSAASIGSTRDKGRQKRLSEVGHILGGLICPGFKGQWVAVNEGAGTWFWKPDRQLPVKHNAFWTKARAMEALGLIERVPGQHFKTIWGTMSGNAARIRATPLLLEWAQECGCSLASATQDWKLVQPATIKQMDVPLVCLKDFPANRRQARSKAPTTTTETIPLPDSLREVEQFMKQLSKRLHQFHFSGCCPPALSARFIGSEHFHGRIYALGSDNYQNGISKEERRLIRINDQPVEEVGVSASFLSIALALLGAPVPEGDPYRLPGLPDALRPAIKHWFVVFFGNGKAVKQWPDTTREDIREAVDARTIMEAVFQRYPELKNLQQIIPPAVAATVPHKLRSWAIGQYLTNVEAKIMRVAMTEHMNEGGVVLPLHDALLVPATEQGKAYTCLQRASRAILGRELLTNLF